MKEKVHLEPVSEMAKGYGAQLADMLKACTGCGNVGHACSCPGAVVERRDPRDPQAGVPEAQPGKKAGVLAKALVGLRELLAKSQVKGYTRADGTLVAPHSNKVIKGQGEIKGGGIWQKGHKVKLHAPGHELHGTSGELTGESTQEGYHNFLHVNTAEGKAHALNVHDLRPADGHGWPSDGEQPIRDKADPVTPGAQASLPGMDAGAGAPKAKPKTSKSDYKLDAQGKLAMSGASKYSKLEGAAQFQANAGKPTQVLKSPNGLFVVPSGAKWCKVLRAQGFSVALDYNGKPPAAGGGQADPEEGAGSTPKDAAAKPAPTSAGEGGDVSREAPNGADKPPGPKSQDAPAAGAGASWQPGMNQNGKPEKYGKLSGKQEREEQAALDPDPGEPTDAHYAQMEDTLANDDNSSDEEIQQHWHNQGIHPKHAAAAIKHRDAFLTDPIPEKGKLKGLMAKKPKGGGGMAKGGLAISADLMARVRGGKNATAE